MNGHGKPDEGAQSSTGTTEAATNLKIALKLQNLLEQSGTIVILTRSDENAIYECMVYFPGTAYNLNFVLKREEGRI